MKLILQSPDCLTSRGLEKYCFDNNLTRYVNIYYESQVSHILGQIRNFVTIPILIADDGTILAETPADIREVLDNCQGVT